MRSTLEPVPTILVIDGDSTSREAAEAALEECGFQIVLARNGEQGMRAFLNARPDIVIVDTVLPQEDGLEVIREIRRARTDASILALARADEKGSSNSSLRAIKLGADAAVLKPFETHDVLRALISLPRHRRDADAGTAAAA